MRYVTATAIGAAVLLALSGCTDMPGLNAESQAARDARLQGGLTPPDISAAPLDAVALADDIAEQTAAGNDALSAQIEAELAARAAQDAPDLPDATLAATTDGTQAPPPASAVQNEAGLSAENSFDAVAGQRSIEDDAALLARNRAQYVVIQPTDMPERSGTDRPNIVAYAVRTTNPLGVMLYRRGPFHTVARAQRNCAKFVTGDVAQEEFLARGGPAVDPLGLDPDGDGFACRWDPTPFRLVHETVLPEAEGGEADS